MLILFYFEKCLSSLRHTTGIPLHLQEDSKISSLSKQLSIILLDFTRNAIFIRCEISFMPNCVYYSYSMCNRSIFFLDKRVNPAGMKFSLIFWLHALFVFSSVNDFVLYLLLLFSIILTCFVFDH